MTGEAEVEAEVDRLIREGGYSNTETVRASVRRHILTERGILQEPTPARPSRHTRRLKIATPESVDRFAEDTERIVERAERERRAKRKTQGTKRHKIAYDFAPVPDVWVRYMARHFPDKADRLLNAVLMFSRGKRTCWPSVRTLARLTGYSNQTVQDLLRAFEFCQVIRIGKRPSGDRKVKRANLYNVRPVTAWHLERAKEARAYLRALRETRKGEDVGLEAKARREMHAEMQAVVAAAFADALAGGTSAN
jgi:hypothetical protein